MIRPHHIDEAYDWLCKQRRHYPSNADIWHLRFHWNIERKRIITAMSDGEYYFSPLQKITKADGTIIHLWSSTDSLVLKALTLAIAPVLPVSKRCTHIKGHGGLKYAVRDVCQQLPNNRFVIRTDVKAFYESIDHHLLLDKLAEQIKDRFILNLLWQSMHRCVEHGGLFRDINKGIPRGCPLSPLLGAFFLTELDQTFEKQDLFYVRYMDDILIMTKTRWHLRKAIGRLNQAFNAVKLQKHPAKTFIGRIEKGFDFLGYHFSQTGLTLAAKTITNAIGKWLRLYEQQKTAPEGAALMDDYCRRWQIWTVAGLPANICQNIYLIFLTTSLERHSLWHRVSYPAPRYIYTPWGNPGYIQRFSESIGMYPGKRVNRSTVLKEFSTASR